MIGISQVKVMWVLLLVVGAVTLGGCGSNGGNSSTTPGNTNIFYTSSLGFRNNSTVGWGYNGFGQLGEGTTTSHTDPRATALVGVKGAVLGGYHALAFGTYTAWTAGGNGFGQLGRGLAANVSQDTAFRPVSFASYTTMLNPKPGMIVAVAAGGTHSLLADSTGKVWAWGGGGYGQLGNNAFMNSTAPVTVVMDSALTPLPNIVKLAAGGSHSLALDSTGVVYAWGYNSYGQVGLPLTFTTREYAFLVAGLPPTIIEIAAAGSYSLALDSLGYLYAWGYNGRGQIGINPALASVVTPFKSFSGVTKVAAGLAHVAALRADGTVWTWGFNGYGQLGDNSKNDRFKPAPVPGLVGVVSDVRAFGNQTFAKIGTSWYAWGDNSQGQLGYSTGTTPYAMTPGQVQGF